MRRAARAAAAAVAIAAVATRATWTRTSRGGAASTASSTRSAPETLGLGAFRRDVAAMDRAWARLGDCTVAREPRCAAAAFADARRAYKRQEVLLEMLAPSAAVALNGRRQDEDDDEAPPPGTHGSAFATVESALPFLSNRAPAAADAAPGWTAAAAAVDEARAALRVLRAQSADFRTTAAMRFAAARLEVARAVTLGITGFDTPVTHAGVTESAVALRGVAALLRAGVAPRDGSGSVALRGALAALDRAAGYLEQHPAFDALDRVTFVAEYSEPALRVLDAARRAAHVPPLVTPSAWVGATLFERGAFNTQAYAPVHVPPPSIALTHLGARLFVDPRLSGDGSRSCASCHDPAHAFADGRRTPVHLASAMASPGGSAAAQRRNTPSVLASGYEPALFADARAVTLEEQAAVVLASPAEMGSSAERAARRIGALPEYREAFAVAFGTARTGARGPDTDAHQTDADATPEQLRVALAAYVRSLARTESRVDLAFRGDPTALTPHERRGASLFLGRAGCGTCHFAPLFSGAAPPAFRSVDAEVLGVPATASGRRLDADEGRGAVDHRPEHEHAFKPPTVRNVALTAPYMHSGVFWTLADVVAFYDDGGGVGRGVLVGNQTLPAQPLRLSRADRNALLAFLRALTDTALAR